MSVKDAAYELARNLKDIKGIEAVILFGSAVKNEIHKKSDIDIFLMFNLQGKNPEIGEEGHETQKIAIKIENKYNLQNPFSFVFFNKGESIDSDFLWEVVKDGITLYCKPELILGQKDFLKPAAFISYSYGEIPQKDKMFVKRQLYGYKIKTEHKGKKYTSEREGIVSKYGKKMGRATFMIEAGKTDEIIELFDEKQVKYSLNKIWI
ncbi:MAG: nucleotidyltransferase domain-containing protein [Methanobacterium sp.]|uniref:nucleotidyltransferase domain-containing protein n=1 Tax=Methanobacterium sp. TaxID=2164 RepID=UPI003D64587B|nr:nucleotidyltransferase domain-containing protein [Methanobacterium sp.]